MTSLPPRDVLNLRDIGTNLDRCLTAEAGTVPTAALIDDLERAHFDQAPLVQGRKALGVFKAIDLGRLAAHGRPAEPEDLPTAARTILPADCPRDSLLELLSSELGVVARDRDEWWLVTVSDLNRHRFRSSLYATFAELEALVARVIEIVHPGDPWEWLTALREDVQARFVGYWVISQRKGMDIGPQAAGTLTELLHVLEKSKEVRAVLEYRSGNELARVTGGLVDLRNKVMHPVRPLVLSCAEVAAMRLQLEGMADLTTRIRAALRERGESSRLPWM